MGRTDIRLCAVRKDESLEHSQQQGVQRPFRREFGRDFGLKQADRVEFVIEARRTVLRPAEGDNPFERYAGVLQTFRRGAVEINAWTVRTAGDTNIISALWSQLPLASQMALLSIAM
jgi:hypothetical protein